MAEDKKQYNQHISTDYEKGNEEGPGFFESAWGMATSIWDITKNTALGNDAKAQEAAKELESSAQSFVDKFETGVEWTDNFLKGNKRGKVQKAQEIQNQINTLSERVLNGSGYSVTEQNEMINKIKNLTKDRDNILDQHSWFTTPINQYDIWRYTRPSETYNDFIKENPNYDYFKQATTQEKVNTLKTNMVKNQNESIEKFWDQVNNDIKAGLTTEDEVKSGEYFMKKANDKTGKGLYGYLNEFINDVDGMSNHQAFNLIDGDGNIRTFFKEDAREVISTLVTSDDIQKAVQNNYNVIKQVESRLDSDLTSEREYAESDYVQGIYNTAIRNLNNLKQETAYLYNNFGKYNGDVFAIEDAFQKETGRKMFSTATGSTDMAMSRGKDYTSEDWATAAMRTLNVGGDINIDYPDTAKYVMSHNWVTDTFSLLGLVSNTARDAIAAATDKAAVYSNTAYYLAFRKEYSWEDIDELIQMNKNVQMGMGSLRSLKQELTNNESRWSRTYDTLLAISDAAPTISKEALTFALSEGLMNSMGVQSTAEMVTDIQKGRQYAKIVDWNRGLLEFDETGIIGAKLMEFYGRGIIQNYLLSASAAGNFSEPYSDLDLGLDIAFGFIDVMTLGKGLGLGRGKIVTESRKQILRQSLKDTLKITDEQWEKLMSSSIGRKLVDQTATEMREQGTKAIDDLGRKVGKSKDEILSEIQKAIKDANSQGLESGKIYTNAKKRIDNAIKTLEDNALVQVVAKGADKFSKEIVDKIEYKTIKLLNGQDKVIPMWKKGTHLTVDEFKEILEKSNIPAFTRMRHKMQAYMKSKGEIQSNIENYRDRVSELKNIDRSTEEGQILYDRTSREINEDYNRHLRNTMVKGSADNLYATPTSYRRWEYEKYGRPNGYRYWDVEYTYLAQGNNKKEVQEVLNKRLKEYADEIEDMKKAGTFNNPYKYTEGLSEQAVKFSNEITGKVNLVGLNFSKACEYNPNLKFTGQGFFDAVLNADWLEVYEKNMILWSVTKDGKVTGQHGTLFNITGTKARKGEIPHQRATIFGSIFEQEYFLGKNGTFGSIEILTKGGTIGGEYSILSHNNGTFLRIHDEAGRKYTIQIKEGKFLMDDHTARITKGALHIRFRKYGNNSYSGLFELYGKQGDEFEKRINRLRLEKPKLYGYVSTMQKLELALTKNLDKTIFKNKKESVRNWYQSGYAKDAFKEQKLLSTAELKSGYLDIVDEFDVPFSYFMEVKKMIKDGLITEKEGAAMILSASGSGVVENSDYFIVNAGAKVKGNLQTHMFHQSGVVMLPSNNQFGFEPYFYERITGSEGLYNLYTADSSEFAIGQLGINPETGTMLVQFGKEDPMIISEIRIDKHISSDYDSKVYTKYTQEKYIDKRNEAFDEFVKKSKETSFNFNMIQDLEKDTSTAIKDKYQVIVKGDKRGIRNTYNSDIKVAKENQKEINDIFHFKQLSTQTKGGQGGMFYSWLKYSVLPKFFEKNVGVRDISEGANILEASKSSGLDHNIKIVDTDGEGVRIFVDTKDMGFDVNYIYNQDLNKGTIIMKVQDGTPEGRIVSIDYVGKFNIENIDGNSYMRFGLLGEDGYDYYLKLTPSIERLNAFEVNTLMLSKADYDQFILNQDKIRKAIGTKSGFIYNNMNDFPDTIRRLIFEGADETEVYTAMKSLIISNDMMKEIAAVKGIDLNTATMENMLAITQEHKQVVEAVEDVAKLGYEISQDKMLKYYKYLYGENTFGASSIIDIIDGKLGLTLFRERTVNSGIREWLTNLVVIDRGGQNLSESFYNYAQRRIMEVRLAQFEDDFNSGVFSNGLDLTKAADYKIYQDNVREAYEYATQILNTTEIRKEWYSLRRKGILKKYQGRQNKLQDLYTNANNVNDLSKVLIKSKEALGNISGIKGTGKKSQKKISKVLKPVTNIEPGVNRYDKIFFDELGNRKNIEQIADTIADYIDMGFTHEEIGIKLAQGLYESGGPHYGLNKIIDLEKEFMKSSDEYKSLFEGSRLSFGDIGNLNSIQRGEILEINFDKDLKMLENSLVIPKGEHKKARQRILGQLRELRKDANMILEFNRMGEDVSSLVKDYINKRTELIGLYERNVKKIVDDIDIQKAEQKKSLNVSYKETKKTEIFDEIANDIDETFAPENKKPKRETNWGEGGKKEVEEINTGLTNKEVYGIHSLDDLEKLKNTKGKERGDLRIERNQKQSKLRTEGNKLSETERLQLEEDIVKLNAKENVLDSEISSIYREIQERKDGKKAQYIFDLEDETTIRLTKQLNEVTDRLNEIRSARDTEWSKETWDKFINGEGGLPKDAIESIKEEEKLMDLHGDLHLEYIDYKNGKVIVEETNTQLEVVREINEEGKTPIEVGTEYKEISEDAGQDLGSIKAQEAEEDAFLGERPQEVEEAIEEIKQIEKGKKKKPKIEKKDNATAFNVNRGKKSEPGFEFKGANDLEKENLIETQEMLPFYNKNISDDWENINKTFRAIDPSWSTFFNGAYEGGASYYNMLNHIIYKNVDTLEYGKVTNHFLEENLISDSFREGYAKLFQSNDTLKMFLNSEEGITMVLNTVYYRIPMPEKLIKGIEDVYGISLPRGISYDQAFTRIQKAVDRKYKIKTGKMTPPGMDYGFWKIDNGSVYSYFQYLDTIPNQKIYALRKDGQITEQGMFGTVTVENKDFTKQTNVNIKQLYNKYKNLDNKFITSHADDIEELKTLYSKKRLNEEEKERLSKLMEDDHLTDIALYDLYIDNSYNRGLWVMPRMNAGPMSIFEFTTLRKVAKESNEALIYFNSLLKRGESDGLYRHIPFGKQEGDWRKDFYRLLNDEDNINIFLDDFRYSNGFEYNIPTEGLLSPYYRNNYNESVIRREKGLNDQRKLETEGLTDKEKRKLQQIHNEAMENYGRIVTDSNGYADIIKNFQDKESGKFYRSQYRDVLVQAGDQKTIDEIENFIKNDTEKIFNEPEITTMNEIILPVNRTSAIEGVDKKITKKGKQVSDSTIVEAKKINCRKK